MEFFHIFWLAVLQGLTEFLPISSSAHLILPSTLLGWPDQGLAFDVAVHVGVLFAVVAYFRKDVVELLTAWFGWFKGRRDESTKLAWLIIAATIPAVIVGAASDSFIEAYLRSGWVIAATTAVFGVLLWVSDKKSSHSKPLSDITLSSALAIGFAQCLALIPGTSRSGITMTMALFLGFTRTAAARFSFLLSMPLIAGAGTFKAVQLSESGSTVIWSDLAIGAFIACISAFFCIKIFMNVLDKIGMFPFMVYRLILAAILVTALW